MPPFSFLPIQQSSCSSITITCPLASACAEGERRPWRRCQTRFGAPSYILLGYSFYVIKLTHLKCATQWYLVQLQKCATITLIFF